MTRAVRYTLLGLAGVVGSDCRAAPDGGVGAPVAMRDRHAADNDDDARIIALRATVRQFCVISMQRFACTSLLPDSGRMRFEPWHLRYA